MVMEKPVLHQISNKEKGKSGKGFFAFRGCFFYIAAIKQTHVVGAKVMVNN